MMITDKFTKAQLMANHGLRLTCYRWFIGMGLIEPKCNIAGDSVEVTYEAESAERIHGMMRDWCTMMLHPELPEPEWLKEVCNSA